jgi:type IV pilus assembly protein PilE
MNLPKRPGLRRQTLKNGFTLVELLVVVALIGLLTSLALPIYQQAQHRGQRSLAKLALMQAAHWMERAASSQGQYPAASAVPANLMSPEDLLYQLSMTSSAQSFVVTAQPKGTQTSDPCGSMSLSSTGERSVKNATLSVAQCWSR